MRSLSRDYFSMIKNAVDVAKTYWLGENPIKAGDVIQAIISDAKDLLAELEEAGGG